MKKKLIFITLIILMLLSTISLGNSLTLKLKSDKKTVKKGDHVIVTVDWSEKMQAADFSLLYDNNSLKYVKSDVDSFCTMSNNEIKVAWFSMDDTEKTYLEFEFEATEKGKSSISTKINAGFADKDLNIPENYDTESKIEIKVKNSSNIFIPILIVVLVIISILVFLRLNAIRKRNNRRSRK